MTLSPKHVEILKDVLKKECKGRTPVPRSKLYKVFEKKTRSGIEQYKFVRDLSGMIRKGQLPEYEMCMGRNGGVRIKHPLEFVTVQFEDNIVIGTVSAEKLSEFISSINVEYKGYK
jgi:hypothetical protein